VKPRVCPIAPEGVRERSSGIWSVSKSRATPQEVLRLRREEMNDDLKQYSLDDFLDGKYGTALGERLELFRDDRDRFLSCDTVPCFQSLTREVHDIRRRPNLKKYTRPK
jgi:hypothetical protein